jgi:hypothetical protein
MVARLLFVHGGMDRLCSIHEYAMFGRLPLQNSVRQSKSEGERVRSIEGGVGRAIRYGYQVDLEVISISSHK